MYPFTNRLGTKSSCYTTDVISFLFHICIPNVQCVHLRSKGRFSNVVKTQRVNSDQILVAVRLSLQGPFQIGYGERRKEARSSPPLNNPDSVASITIISA
ncbi:hypothetical protein GQ43DRAFT_276966 [Delitschia confertaspora ATCC 74209]|uniref:Uncharacterized protein n=1 Tax=Delitschia confertaspora ATCC 74209 TaxID=1513339 RepID=A0A9P4JF38_9PLEO|nr:hypothetical protein GQ43DRAFT_276966 [Delitschia confertaspora ATCC 74209]